jgi:signal transduction histidine kinase
MSSGSETQVSVQVSGKVVAPPTAIEHHLLRIAQEALNNALKYAAARAININLEYGSDIIRLVVRDNGRGFNAEDVLSESNGHFGLQNLKSRARKMGGTLKIDSVVGSGTIIEATVPVNLTPLKSGSNGPNSPA